MYGIRINLRIDKGRVIALVNCTFFLKGSWNNEIQMVLVLSWRRKGRELYPFSHFTEYQTNLKIITTHRRLQLHNFILNTSNKKLRKQFMYNNGYNKVKTYQKLQQKLVNLYQVNPHTEKQGTMTIECN